MFDRVANASLIYGDSFKSWSRQEREREDFSFICHIPGVLNINFCNSEKGF